MRGFSFPLSQAQLRMFASVCANLSAGWLIIVFATRDPLTIVTIVTSLLYAVIAWKVGVKAEEALEIYD